MTTCGTSFSKRPDISSLLRRAVGEHIPLRITLPDGSIQVDLDRGQLTTALLNLVINARDAVTDAGEIDILFVDIVMPGSMNGREFAAWAHEVLPDAEILLTTGYTDASHHGDCPSPVLQKPYRMEELSAYLSARFGNRQIDQPEPL